MKKREIFSSAYTTLMDAEASVQRLKEESVYLDNSTIYSSVLSLFDLTIDLILSEDAKELLYEQLLWNDDFSLEDILSELDPYWED